MMLPSSPSPSPSPSAPPPSSPTALLRPHPSNEVQVFGLAIGFAVIVFVCLAIATFLHAQFKSWSDISVKVNGDGWSVSGNPRAVFRFLRRESTKSLISDIVALTVAMKRPPSPSGLGGC